MPRKPGQQDLLKNPSGRILLHLPLVLLLDLVLLLKLLVLLLNPARSSATRRPASPALDVLLSQGSGPLWKLSLAKKRQRKLSKTIVRQITAPYPLYR